MKLIAMLPVALLFAATSCTNTHDRTNQSEPNTVISNQKNDYVRTTENHFDDVERKIDRWKIEAKEASGSLKDKRYDQIATLEKKLDGAREQLGKLKICSASDYKGCKEDVEKSVQKLDEEFEAAMRNFH